MINIEDIKDLYKIHLMMHNGNIPEQTVEDEVKRCIGDHELIIKLGEGDDPCAG